MNNKFLSLQDEVKFRNYLLRNRIIKEFVEFKDGYNVVAIDFNGKTYYADMRIAGNDVGLRYSIYCKEKDYIEEEPPFKCIGAYNRIKDSGSVEQMDFSIGCNHSATLGYITDPNRYEITTKTFTGDFVSAKDRQKIFTEFLNASKEGDNALEEFYGKYADEYILTPVTLLQKFTFDKNPMARINNFNDGYKIVKEMFENNAEFDDDKLDEDVVFGSILATKNGVTAMKKIGATSVKSECDIEMQNFFSDMITMNMYSSIHRFAINEKDGKDYSVGYLDNLDIRYLDEGKQLHYDLSSSMPKMFRIDHNDVITGIAKQSGPDKFMNYLGMHKLNQRLNAMSNVIYYGKDAKIKGIDPEDMQIM